MADQPRRSVREPKISKERQQKENALKEIKRLKEGGRRLRSLQDDDEEFEDIFQVVDEEQFSAIAEKRRKQFVVDDEEGAYADDGEDHWDSNYYAEQATSRTNQQKKKRAVKREREKKSDDENESEQKKPKSKPIEQLFAKQIRPPTKSYTATNSNIGIEGNEMLKDLLMNPLLEKDIRFDDSALEISTQKDDRKIDIEQVEKESLVEIQTQSFPSAQTEKRKDSTNAKLIKKEPVNTEKAKESGISKVIETPSSPIKAPFRKDYADIIAENKMKNFQTPPLSPTKDRFTYIPTAPITIFPPLKLEDTLEFFWVDGIGDVANSLPGTVFLFGKIVIESKMYNCTVRIKGDGIMHSYYVVPRQQDEDGKPISMKDVYSEVKELKGYFGVSEIKAKPVTRKYVFGNPDVPNGSSVFLRVRVPFSARSHTLSNMPTSGRTFSAILGTTTTAIERVIISKGLRGPSWTIVHKPVLIEKSHSVTTSPYEIEIDSAKFLEVAAKSTKMLPTVSGVTVNIKTVFNPSTKQSEVVMLSCATQREFSIETATMNIPIITHTWIRPFSLAQCKEKEKTQRFLFPPNTESQFANLKTCTLCATEKELIEHFLDLIAQEDPDLIIGHNMSDYVLPVIIRCCQQNSINKYYHLGRIIHRSALSNAKLKHWRFVTNGRMICDTFGVSKELLQKQKNYHLDELSRTQLGITLGEIREEEIPYYFESPGKIQNLMLFSLKECTACLDLVNKLAVIPLTKQITNLSGYIWNRTFLGLRAERVEYLLNHSFSEENFIVPEHKSFKEIQMGKRGKGYRGGMVLDPIPGLYSEWVLLLDFKSLYPSLIQEYNICFTTIDVSTESDQLPPSSSATGVLPRVVRTLVEQRRMVKNEMAKSKSETQTKQLDIRQSALKILANSLYGCLGFEHSRFYAKPLAAMVTLQGRTTLLRARDIVTTELGMNVIYGDTDSLMIHTGSAPVDLAGAVKKAREIQERINRESVNRMLEIDLDGIYQHMLLLKKKKYAALEMKSNGKTEKVVKGIDVVRRDWSDVARTAGQHVLDILLSGKRETMSGEVLDYLSDLAKKLKSDTFPWRECVITKGLTKAVDQYPDAAAHPHVQVALRLIKQNKRVTIGDHIPFVICREGSGDIEEVKVKSIANKARHPSEIEQSLTTENPLKIDTDYYLEQQLYAVVSRMCEPIEDLPSESIALALEIDPDRVHAHPTYQSNLNSELATENDLSSENFDDCMPFVVCPCQDQNNRFEFSMMKTTCSCPLETHFTEARVRNALTSHIRNLKAKFNSVELQCTDCHRVSRQLFFKKGYFSDPVCIDPTCKGVMIQQHSNLFKEYLYLASIFQDKNDLVKEFARSCSLCQLNFNKLTNCWADKNQNTKMTQEES